MGDGMEGEQKDSAHATVLHLPCENVNLCLIRRSVHSGNLQVHSGNLQATDNYY